MLRALVKFDSRCRYLRVTMRKVTGIRHIYVLIICCLVLVSMYIYNTGVSTFGALVLGSRNRRICDISTDNNIDPLPEVRPVNDSKIKVVILAYMRSGSSFLGSMFDHNSEVFYAFEPEWTLVYKLLHGYRPIRFLGGETRPPIDEVDQPEMIHQLLKGYLTCNFSLVDEDSLRQPYMTDGNKTALFYNCLHQSPLSTCLEIMLKQCSSSNIRVIKTIFVRMTNVVRLMQEEPGLRIIHLVRDPRAIMWSRVVAGEYYHNDQMNTFSGVCADMTKDIQAHRAVEDLFPGRIKRVHYEDVAQDPEKAAKDLYRFLKADMPTSVVNWVHHSSQGNVNRGRAIRVKSSLTGSKWRDNILWTLVKKIDNICYKVYGELGYLSATDEQSLRNHNFSLRKAIIQT